MPTQKQKAKQRTWYLKNRQKIIAKVMEHQRANHDEYLAYQKRHREKNIELSREKSRQWKAANRERHRESSRKYAREHAAEISQKLKDKRRKLKQTILDAYGSKCACCGETTYEFLTLDHSNGDGASHRKSVGRSHKIYQELIERNFPPEFRLLCFNCNSSLGFYGYCPHCPDAIDGVPIRRRKTLTTTS